MKTKLHSKEFYHLKAYLLLVLFLVPSIALAQDPLPTSNTEITGVTCTFAFDEEITPTKNNVKEHTVDNDPDTDWAGFGDTGGEVIFDLGDAYDLVELQYLTVVKSVAYEFQISVSTDGVNYTYPLGMVNQQSNLDATYKSFDLGTNSGVTFVKLECYGRPGDSQWNTISELKFYSAPTASVKDNELSGFSLYPNPASDSFFLSNLNTTVNNMQIVSLDGKIILSDTIDSLKKEITINTPFLANGVYLVKLSDTSRGISASKMLVVRR